MSTSDPSPGSVPEAGPGPATRFRGWLGRHPLLLVAFLSPGIVEYLSGSSELTGLVVAPPLFFLLLAGNLGLYVPGVLLIREARVRWNRGWGTVVLLGVAYAIVEEGLALSTLFNAHAGVSGVLGSYGHFAGVSWVWLAGVVAVHVVFSISVPIYLLDLALPNTRGAPLLSDRGIALAAAVLALDSVALMVVVDLALHFFAGVPLIVGSLVAIALLIAAARSVPSGLFEAPTAVPTQRPRFFGVLGLLFFPSVILVEALGGAWGAQAALTFLAVVALLAAFFFVFRRAIGQRSNEPQLVALAVGLIAPIAFAGLVGQLGLPVVLLADLAAAWFFLHLWGRCRPRAVELTLGSAVVAA
jgi:hypothetical protein